MLSLLPNFQLISTNFLLFLASVSLLVYYFLKKKFSYWRNRGIPDLSPARCFVDSLQFIFGRKNFMLVFDEQYKKLAGHKYGGTFQLTEPSLLIRDPELIKLTLVKNFSHFQDRAPKYDESYDQLAGNLFQLTGERWRQLRRKTSPAFSAVKMKTMYRTLEACAKELDAYLQRRCSGTGDVEINLKEVMSNYTLDVIGSCAMGIECDAIRNPDSEVKKMLLKIFQFNLSQTLYAFLATVHPKVPQFFGLRPRPAEVDEFLVSLCKRAIELKGQDASSSERKDLLQILMNLRSDEIEDPTGSAKSFDEIEGPLFTENVLMGLISIFLLAGFEPVATTLTFCLYELALHPKIQDQILKEIQTVKKEVGARISYDDMKKFQYTEQVINETLRKYPVSGILIRNCTEPFKMPDSSFVVEKNVKVLVPVYSLHRDPQYYPEPEKFDPDRFSEANIDKIVPGTYMPFGDGPRFCIGMRLSMIDIKTILITLVSNYTLHKCAKTPEQMEFDNKSFTLTPKGGEMWLRLQKRR